MSESKKDVPESTNSEKPKTKEEEDEELSKLLDGALSDFSAVSTKPQPKAKENVTKEPAVNDDAALWSEDFLKDAAAKFEENMQAFLSGADGAGGSGFMEQLQQGMPDLGGENLDDGENIDFTRAIDETLRNLSQNLRVPMNDEEIMRNLGNLTNPNCDPNDLLPFMQQMMQSLLSKDILYPALTSILEKYPDWLKDNKSKLSAEDFERYSKQLKFMQEVCNELDKESPSDSSEVKTRRYETILSLMHKMQDCGQPPAELAGDLGPMMNFDEHGNPQLPTDFGQNCCVM